MCLLDGAMGTELHRRGCPMDTCIEKWALEHPEVVVSVHKDYIESGAEIIYTCTFGANRVRLGQHGLTNETERINERLASLARNCASNKILVAGCVGPTGLAVNTGNSGAKKRLAEIFTEQIKGLVAGSVDLIVIETMTHFHEAQAAFLVAKEGSDLPVLVSFAFGEDGITRDGVTAEQACQQLQELGAAAVGCNCAPDASQMADIIARMKNVTNLSLLAKPSAGVPTVEDGRLIYPYLAKDFVQHCKKLIDAGAVMIGGCCGTTPNYISRLRQCLP
ncbi:MAG: homocysteine S-methyltransferase family protein [Candidatus Zixiibacteriota bacterium]